MNKLITKCSNYLRQTLEITVVPKKWAEADILPYYLKENYNYFLIEILSSNILIMEQIDNEEYTPITLKKHYEAVQKHWKGEILFLCDSITSYNRKRLVEHKIPFIIPDTQLYLPDLGIDLREHFKQIRSLKNHFSPSTQLLLLYSILKKNSGPFTPAEIAVILHYTPMTLTRAFDELEAAEIGTFKTHGRERILALPDDARELWEKTRPYFKNPVRTILWVRIDNTIYNNINFLESGLTALSRYSMLAEPDYEIKAISFDTWKLLRNDNRIQELPFKDKDAVELQIWRYSPELLSINNKVDKLSLYLSIENEKDERVQKALSEMMEGFNW